MGYLPNLIPEEHRVLKEYFRAGKGKDAPKIKWPLATYLLSALFLIAALTSLAHPIVFIAFASLSWIISPPGHKWLERKFRFKFLTKVKLIFCAAMYIAILPLAAYYNTQDEMEANLLKIKEAKEVREKTLAEKRDKLRKDSLEQILNEALANKRSSESSLRQLAYAYRLANSRSDSDQIDKVSTAIKLEKTKRLVDAGKFKTALPVIAEIMEVSPDNSELYYYRGLCLSKTGQKRNAVADLSKAMEMGNERASRLYHKVNPVKRRVAYYVTRCCDGTTSSAKGRGACSWHGGSVTGMTLFMKNIESSKMERSIFQRVDLRPRSFLQKLLKQEPAENAVISVNNLLSSQAILSITRKEILDLEELYGVKLKEEFSLNLEEFYTVYYNDCLHDFRLDQSDFRHLSHLKRILDLDEQTVRNLQTKIGMMAYAKAFENEIKNGRLSQVDQDGIPNYKGFGFGLQFAPVLAPFLELGNTIIQKVSLSADISLYDERGLHFNEDYKGILFEFFLANSFKRVNKKIFV